MITANGEIKVWVNDQGEVSIDVSRGFTGTQKEMGVACELALVAFKRTTEFTKVISNPETGAFKVHVKIEEPVEVTSES